MPCMPCVQVPVYIVARVGYPLVVAPLRPAPAAPPGPTLRFPPFLLCHLSGEVFQRDRGHTSRSIVGGEPSVAIFAHWSALGRFSKVVGTTNALAGVIN